MSDHVYKKVELTGTSTISTDDAISAAIAKASLSLRNIIGSNSSKHAVWLMTAKWPAGR